MQRSRGRQPDAARTTSNSHADPYVYTSVGHKRCAHTVKASFWKKKKIFPMRLIVTSWQYYIQHITMAHRA